MALKQSDCETNYLKMFEVIIRYQFGVPKWNIYISYNKLTKWLTRDDEIKIK